MFTLTGCLISFKVSTFRKGLAQYRNLCFRDRSNEKCYFPSDILGNKTSLVNTLLITFCLLLIRDGGDGIFSRDGRWTDFPFKIFSFCVTSVDPKLSLSTTGRSLDRAVWLYNSLDFRLWLNSMAPLWRDMSIAADRNVLAASQAGSNFVGVFLVPDESFLFSLMSSSEILLILCRLLSPWMETSIRINLFTVPNTG